MGKKNNGKRILAFLMILLCLQAFGTLAYYYKDFENTNDYNTAADTDDAVTADEETTDVSTKNTKDKPASEAGKVTPAKPKRNSEEIVKSLTDYISNEKGTYGIYFKDLASDESFGLNDELEYVAASTKKVPMNLYLYSLIVKGKINPAVKLTYQKQFYEGGTGSIQYRKVGTTYTIKELSRLSIVVSDNIATNMLISKLGRSNLTTYMQFLVNHTVDSNKNISSPKDMSIYLNELLTFQKQHPTEGDEFIYNLEHTVFNDRIPKYLPEDLKIAHKIGTQVQAIHDVGIVFAENPYIICIMSKDVDEKRAPEVLATISKMIYEYSQK